MSTGTTQQLALGLERLAELLRAQAWKQQQGSGLNPSQQAVLRRLAEHPEGLRLSQLATWLGVSAASLSDTVATLQRRGDLSRAADPDDGRAIRLSLAIGGRQRLDGLQQSPSPAVMLLDVLSSEQQGELLSLLQLLIAQAQDMGLASGSRTCLGCRYFRPYAHRGAERPHHCDYLDSAFGHTELRIDCAEHEAASPASVAGAIERMKQADSS